MEYIKHSEAEKVVNGAVTAWEYETQSQNMNLALIKIKGRYPEEGFISNTEVDALVHVTEGEGIFGVPTGESLLLSRGDQIHIAKGDVYCFEGSLEIIYAASPKWTYEQTKIHHI